MKYFLIAGEASGDLHAASLITALRNRDPKAEFVMLGGDLMAAAAGVSPVVHYRDMAYMGFVDVIKHARKIKHNFAVARDVISHQSIDCLILVDYPSFNLKMAKFAKKRGLPVYYYIPPKIWAWKAWRVKTIRKVIDQVFAIFPFEVDFYHKHQYFNVAYVGNPSVQEIDEARLKLIPKADFISKNHLPEKPIIALLPGSRLSEIRNNLPIMTEVMRQFPQYRGVVAAAPSVDLEFYRQFTKLPIVVDQTYDLVANARAALVTSGTATLETALLGTPQVAMYRGSGSKLIYDVMKHVLKIPFVTLPNLIADRQVIPELLMHFCTADSVAHELGRILPDRDARADMLMGYSDIRDRLGSGIASVNAAEIIISQSSSVK